MERAGLDYFSYRTGEPLQDYILHFDRGGGVGATFEIARAGYRFLQSACYRPAKAVDMHDMP
jgi:hypothetical protein